MWRLTLKLSSNLKLVAIFCLTKNCITMANFKGKVTIEVTFKDMNVPVGFGMTNAIIYHNCSEQIYVKSPWTKISRSIKNDNFKINILKKDIKWD